MSHFDPKEIHFLDESEKHAESKFFQNYFGRDFLWSDRSSFAQSINLSPFLEAVKQGNVDDLKRLWNSDKSLVDTTPNNAFQIATFHDKPESLEFLLQSVRFAVL